MWLKRTPELKVDHWQERGVPPFCERLLGFSIPQADEVLIVSYGGVHLLRLGGRITVTTDDRFPKYALYDPTAGTARYQEKTYQIIGLHGGSPLLDSPQGEHLALNTKKQTLSITNNGRTEFSMKYENFSGDWAAATFSPEGKYVVLGCPYDFDFRVLERTDTV